LDLTLNLFGLGLLLHGLILLDSVLLLAIRGFITEVIVPPSVLSRCHLTLLLKYSLVVLGASGERIHHVGASAPALPVAKQLIELHNLLLQLLLAFFNRHLQILLIVFTLLYLPDCV